MINSSLNELYSILESYYVQLRVPMCVLDSIDGVLKTFSDSPDNIWTHEIIEYMLVKRNRSTTPKNVPFLSYSTQGLFAGIIIYEDIYIGIGPVMVSKISLSDLYETYYGIFSATDIVALYNISYSAPRMNIEYFANTLSVINKLTNGNYVSFDEIISCNTDFYRNVSDTANNTSNIYSEDYAVNYSKNYDSLIKFEDEVDYAIKTGNRDLIKKMWETPEQRFINSITSVSSASSYLYIRLLTIMSRAAKSGGAEEQAIFRLTDKYVKRLDESSNMHERFSLLTNAAYSFCNLVYASVSRGAYALPAKKCVRFIEDNLSQKITVADLAILCEISERQIFRVFKESFNTSVTEYITDKRLEKAVALLNSTMLPVSEISAECGFNNQSYFSKEFKNRFNVSPTDYRKRKKPAT